MTKDTLEPLPPLGPVNIRDLGGLPIRGGGTTRSGVLLRSDAPRAGDTVFASGGRWPPSAVVDLRSAGEPGYTPYAWGPETDVRIYPVFADAAPTELEHLADWHRVYHEILAGVAQHIAEMVTHVARADRGPTFVHCAAGKDRTGIVIALLLLAAGVTREAVVADYLSSQRNMNRFRDRWATGRTGPYADVVRHASLRVSAEALEGVIDTVTADGVEAWLTSNGVRADELQSVCRALQDD